VIAGADTNFWIRQGVPLIGGGGVTLSTRNGLLPNLRSSKEHGQSNFTNPGLRLFGLGADLDLTPTTRLSLNVNHLSFDRTEVLEVLRQQESIDRTIGKDVSAAVIWRPLAIQNVVGRLSVARMFPDLAFDDLLVRDNRYSVLGNLILKYCVIMKTGFLLWHVLVATLLLGAQVAVANAARETVTPQANRVTAPPAPAYQSAEDAHRKSTGCISCHSESDSKTMHANPAVTLGCVDCHGGDAAIQRPDNSRRNDAAFHDAMKQAHVLPDYAQRWRWPSSRNPPISYTLLHKEAPEYFRFVNPSAYRVVREACGSCHLPQILAAERSIMATGAMLFGGAAYNNGILPYKRYILGEGYTRDGAPAMITPLQPPTED